MTEFLVTGGAGFIGSHLVEGLLKRPDEPLVRVFDNLATGFRKNLSAVADHIQLLEGDLRDKDAVRRAVQGVQVVFHQAALPSVARSVADPVETNNANISGTLNLLIAARNAGVKRVIVASSSSVYGNIPTLPKEESMQPEPVSPYAITKLTGELYARVFSQLYGLETVCLRYFNVFGPRQDPTTQYAGAIAKFITCALHGDPYPVYGDGEQSRDFTFVENVVRANSLAADAAISGCAVMNIAYGERATLNRILTLLNELTGQSLPAHYLPARQGDVRHSLASIERAKKLIGYAPHVSLREGLKRTLEWYRQAGG